MKGLTLWQPMASAIARAADDPRWKLCENRGWPPPKSVLGQRIAIHAAKRADTTFGLPAGYDLGDVARLPRGAIIATARVAGALDLRRGVRVLLPDPEQLLDVDDINDLELAVDQLEQSVWWLGPVGWLLDGVRRLSQPVPQRGAMGLWPVPEHVERLVLERERLAA